MADPLDSIRRLAPTATEGVRWACVLEATAPKAGNVYPGRSFQNLTYQNFVAAAEIAAKQLGCAGTRISVRMLSTVQETASLTKTNVNLGIVLLLGPLVAADETLIANNTVKRSDAAWTASIADVLGRFDGTDGQNIYRTIDVATAGGLGSVESMDVRQHTDQIDILRAMTLAQPYDRIARQYAGGFTDLIETIVPVVWQSMVHVGDVLTGISRAHVQLLMQEPDSLIARKNGGEVALSVQQRAKQVDLDNPKSVARFDESLRSSGHKLNPGTTADLIAAALFILLRTPPSEHNE
jgi:triphosphoribosyl-dephospho-CoA synthase